MTDTTSTASSEPRYWLAIVGKGICSGDLVLQPFADEAVAWKEADLWGLEATVEPCQTGRHLVVGAGIKTIILFREGSGFGQGLTLEIDPSSPAPLAVRWFDSTSPPPPTEPVDTD
jgi:hypothetical protein